MDSQISNLEWSRNGLNYCWYYKDKILTKKTKYPPTSIVKLNDGTGFAVVLAQAEFGKNNAFIINANGSERFRLEVPRGIRDAICFHEMYYIKDELTAVIATNQCDFACVIDINSGKYIRQYETR
ncbi:MAG: hypothetical protein PHD60_11680 [Clostridia bacterium]|nr:hypothetical protein [Clostridia bacterium]